MSQWTDSARARLEQYLAAMRQSLAASGADVNEVTEDLRRHVEEEVAALKLSTVTEQDVAQILARVGAPEAPPRPVEPGVRPSPPEAPRRKRGFAHHLATVLLLLFGVLLPLGTVIFEFFTGACAGVLFDPIPSVGHAALVTLVPVINLIVWVDALRPNPRWRTPLGWASGFTIGIGLVYGLLFLPVSPFAAIGILFFGFGFIPLSPLLALICSWFLRRRLRRTEGDGVPLPGLWRGMGVAWAALVVFTLPTVITEIGIRKANSESPAESAQGVGWLRSWGHEDELLRACYGRSGRGEQFYQWRANITPEAARVIYYRVYGRAFNSVPPPKLYAGRGSWNVMEEDYTWDNDQAGDVVAGRVRGLSLVTSREDAMIYPEAGLSYTEWTLEFKNDSKVQREARAQIQLPPGGVVSRLTLWIDGEEREAAFGGRSQVKGAYKQVVQQRRDPVLVTTCGPDRVLMQCFPVPPDGGRMKVRVGVVAPLALTSPNTGCLRWPYFTERNFSISDQVQHSVWAESSQPLEAPGSKLKAETGKPGVYSLRGQLSDHELWATANTVRANRPAAMTSTWSSDTRSGTNQVIHQAIIEKPVSPPDRVVLVVDGTKGMEAAYPAISSALSHLPANVDFAVLLARDGFEEVVPLQKGSPDLYQKVAFGKFRSDGGHDNVPALVRAWDLAAEGKAGAVVWIHGPQPILMDTAEDLRQRFDRSSKPPLLLEVQTQPGPNRVLEKLDGIKPVRSVLRLGKLEEDLSRLFDGWNGKSGTYEFVREETGTPNADAQLEKSAASDHLLRLWAAQEVARLSAARKMDDAIRLAARYQLVTPVTGAVVLETKAQYEQAGLQPAPAETVPTIPEPSATALLLVGVVFLCVQHRVRQRRKFQT